MIEVKKGEVYYFLNIFPEGDYLYLKIKANLDSVSKHGMATSWTVLETNGGGFQKGESYSGNQFQGVALYGLKNYLFEDQHQVVQHIFKRKQ